MRNEFFFIFQLKQKERTFFIPFFVPKATKSNSGLKIFTVTVSVEFMKGVMNAGMCTWCWIHRLREIILNFWEIFIDLQGLSIEITHFHQLTSTSSRQFLFRAWFCMRRAKCLCCLSLKFQQNSPQRKINLKKKIFALESGQKFVHPPSSPFLIVCAKHVPSKSENLGENKTRPGTSSVKIWAKSVEKMES
jgi:hypothetical protein